MITPCYEGQAIFTTTFRSFGTDADARRIHKAVAGSTPLQSDENNEVNILALLLSTTLSIEWMPELTDEVASLKAFWDWVNTHFILRRDEEGYILELSTDPTIGTQVWRKFSRMVGNQAQRGWYDVFSDNQKIYPPSPEMAKAADLPEDLKSDPDFLAEGSQPVDGSGTGATSTSSQLEDLQLVVQPK